MVVVTVGPRLELHWPVPGFVWQIAMISGRLAGPVFADTVIFPVIPTFAVATANAAEPSTPGISMIPSAVGVADRATMSGTWLTDADNSNVSSPVTTSAGKVFRQSKASWTSVGPNPLVGVNENTN